MLPVFLDGNDEAKIGFPGLLISQLYGCAVGLKATCDHHCMSSHGREDRRLGREDHGGSIDIHLRVVDAETYSRLEQVRIDHAQIDGNGWNLQCRVL